MSRTKRGRPSKGLRRQLPALVPLDVAREIEERADILDCAMNDLVNEAITMYLKAVPRPEAPSTLDVEEVPLTRTA